MLKTASIIFILLVLGFILGLFNIANASTLDWTDQQRIDWVAEHYPTTPMTEAQRTQLWLYLDWQDTCTHEVVDGRYVCLEGYVEYPEL